MLTSNKMKIHLDRQKELLADKIPKINQEKKSKKKQLHFAWNKLKFKKKHSFMSQNSEEIEILDFDEPTKIETRKKPKIKFPNIVIKNKFKFATTLVGSLTVLILILSAITGTNIIKVSAKKFLEGLGIYTEEVKSIELQSNNFLFMMLLVHGMLRKLLNGLQRIQLK